MRSITGFMCRPPVQRRKYTYDYAGPRISSRLSLNNTGNEGRVNWGSQQFACRSSDSTTYYDHQDTLGRERKNPGRCVGSKLGNRYVSCPRITRITPSGLPLRNQRWKIRLQRQRSRALKLYQQDRNGIYAEELQ
jgi:hypothetical protein